MKTTIKEIAKACGVSISLVSRIINKDETLRCKPETKERVLKEIERTGYIPDYYAKQLVNHSLKTNEDLCIGYLTYKGTDMYVNAYFDRIVEGINSNFKMENIQVLRFYVDEVECLCRQNRPLHEKMLDGLISLKALGKKFVSKHILIVRKFHFLAVM